MITGTTLAKVLQKLSVKRFSATSNDRLGTPGEPGTPGGCWQSHVTAYLPWPRPGDGSASPRTAGAANLRGRHRYPIREGVVSLVTWTAGLARDLCGDDLGNPLGFCGHGDLLLAEGDADLAGDGARFRIGCVAALVVVDGPGEGGDGHDQAGEGDRVLGSGPGAGPCGEPPGPRRPRLAGPGRDRGRGWRRRNGRRARQGRSLLAFFVVVVAGDVVADLLWQELTRDLWLGVSQSGHAEPAGKPGEG